ncbi:hypothetical protein SCHPADRAFT_702043 [Schizopora paradoxa]|uniref:Uncharacterized protein n=1 Tax=Schizopora paradoxa TaxID=27342 RepID=A0A0H2R2R2_9AGAM|nr:hypothetical protein SCHPADRAFT_702043 [Schizopora paradoxa]
MEIQHIERPTTDIRQHSRRRHGRSMEGDRANRRKDEDVDRPNRIHFLSVFPFSIETRFSLRLHIHRRHILSQTRHDLVHPAHFKDKKASRQRDCSREDLVPLCTAGKLRRATCQAVQTDESSHREVRCTSTLFENRASSRTAHLTVLSCRVYLRSSTNSRKLVFRLGVTLRSFTSIAHSLQHE